MQVISKLLNKSKRKAQRQTSLMEFFSLMLNDLKNHINELQSVFYYRRINIALITGTYFTKYSHINISVYELTLVNHPDNTTRGRVSNT